MEICPNFQDIWTEVEERRDEGGLTLLYIWIVKKILDC
jgi:hypothetical protein